MHPQNNFIIISLSAANLTKFSHTNFMFHSNFIISIHFHFSLFINLKKLVIFNHLFTGLIISHLNTFDLILRFPIVTLIFIIVIVDITLFIQLYLIIMLLNHHFKLIIPFPY